MDNPDRPYVPLAAAGLREALRERAIDVTLYAECFDQVRFGDRPSYLMEYRRWLWQKYTDRHLDALVVRDQALLKLFADAPDNPWRGIPIIYVTLGHLTIDTTRAHPSASGVVMENHFPLLISTIKTLLPARAGSARFVAPQKRNALATVFAPHPPPGQEHNWVTTGKGGQCFVISRLYGPDKPFFDKSWKLPDIESAS